MQHTRADEFRLLEALSENCSDFGQRLLLFPSATTFHTYPKNRYKNILPNEQTRVKLNPISNQEGSDYINANFITLEIGDEQHKYISTQAPLETTFADFWRMVWEQKSTCIISLTKLSEKNRVKADRYWPLQVGESERYGELTVVNQHVLDLGFIVRKFLVSRNEEQRIVLQFHYSDWPDFGVPHCSADIRKMIQLSDIWKQESNDIGLNGPLIVHCSAGVGRSGSFIAMHAGMKGLQKASKSADSSPSPSPHYRTEENQNRNTHRMEDFQADFNSSGRRDSESPPPNDLGLEMPNVMELVRVMRNQRHGMVQTIEQYEFIYTVLDDEIADRRKPKSSPRPRSTSGSGGSGSGDPILSGSLTEQNPNPSSGTSCDLDSCPSSSASVHDTSCPSSCLSCSCSSSPLSSSSSPSSPTSSDNTGLDVEQIFAALSCGLRSNHSCDDRNHEKELSRSYEQPIRQMKALRGRDGDHTDGDICEVNCSPQSSEVFLSAVAVSG